MNNLLDANGMRSPLDVNKDINECVRRLLTPSDLAALSSVSKSSKAVQEKAINDLRNDYKKIAKKLKQNVGVYISVRDTGCYKNFKTGKMFLKVMNEDGTFYVYKLFLNEHNPSSEYSIERFTYVTKDFLSKTKFDDKKFKSDFDLHAKLYTNPSMLWFICLKALDEMKTILQIDYNLSESNYGEFNDNNIEQAKGFVKRLTDLLHESFSNLPLFKSNMFLDEASSRRGGAKMAEKVKVLGRLRRIVMEGKVAMVTVNGKLVRLTEARQRDAAVKRTKK